MLLVPLLLCSILLSSCACHVPIFFNHRSWSCLQQVGRDLAKALPVLTVFSLPIAGYLAPALGYIFPKTMLPPQFWTSPQRLRFMLEVHVCRGGREAPCEGAARQGSRATQIRYMPCSAVSDGTRQKFSCCDVYNSLGDWVVPSPEPGAAGC